MVAKDHLKPKGKTQTSTFDICEVLKSTSKLVLMPKNPYKAHGNWQLRLKPLGMMDGAQYGPLGPLRHKVLSS